MSTKLKVGILDLYKGVPNEGMRCIKMLLEEFFDKSDFEGSYEIFDVRGEEAVPEIHNFDVFISTGGPGSPLLEGHTWEANYFGFIDQLIQYNQENEKKKHLFAICHSFQLLIQHFQFSQVGKRKSTSFGVMPVHKTEAGEHEAIFEGLEEPFWAVDSRDYQAIQADFDKIEAFGASILCIEKERPHVPLERAIMAVRFTPEIIGTQFHPEADADGMYRYFQTEEKRAAVINEYGEEKFNDMLEYLEDPEKIMFTESVIIPNFLRIAAGQLVEQGVNY